MRLDPPGATSFPQPQSFFWLPIDSRLHAAGILDQNLPPGELITTFCGRELTRTRVSNAEWRWPVCPECWSAAGTHLGLRASTIPGTRGDQT
ncbi:MAG: zinc finger protein [Pseudonocardiaceae bacterium]